MKITNRRLEKTAEKFTGLMIKRITEVEKDWTKPWLPVSRKDFLPRNLNGRHYSGGNTLMLLIPKTNWLSWTDGITDQPKQTGIETCGMNIKN